MSKLILKECSDLEAAYIAGLVDGEAYLGIKKSTWQQRHNHSKSASYSERVQIKMTDKEPLEFIHDRFGGSFYLAAKAYQSKSGFHSNKPLWVLVLSDVRAITLIKRIRLHLKVKHREADLIMQLRKSKEDPLARKRGNIGGRRKGKGQSMSETILRHRETLYISCKNLHKRGGEE